MSRHLSSEVGVGWLDVLTAARKTWPMATVRSARKACKCDNRVCGRDIAAHERYIDPGEACPDRAGGFGNYRYCLHCGGGTVAHGEKEEFMPPKPERVLSNTQRAREKRARAALARQEMRLVKSRVLNQNVDDYGGYQIVNYQNTVVDGVRFDLSLDDVEKFLKR